MNQTAAIVILAIFALMVLASVSARRDLFRPRARYLIAIGTVGGIVYAFAQKMTDQSHAVLYAIGAGLFAGFAAVRTLDWLYNPKKHEIDHVVPWSRGGGNEADNLKVIPKARNRAKSNRSPWWDIFG